MPKISRGDKIFPVTEWGWDGDSLENESVVWSSLFLFFLFLFISSSSSQGGSFVFLIDLRSLYVFVFGLGL
jgi:hypothetical protein